MLSLAVWLFLSDLRNFDPCHLGCLLSVSSLEFKLWASADMGSSGTFGVDGLVGGSHCGASHLTANLVDSLASQISVFIGQGHHEPVDL